MQNKLTTLAQADKYAGEETPVQKNPTIGGIAEAIERSQTNIPDVKFWGAARNLTAGHIIGLTSTEMNLSERNEVVRGIFTGIYQEAQEAGYEHDSSEAAEFRESVLAQVCVARMLDRQGYDVYLPRIDKGAGIFDLIVTDETESGAPVIIPLKVITVRGNIDNILTTRLDTHRVDTQELRELSSGQQERVFEKYHATSDLVDLFLGNKDNMRLLMESVDMDSEEYAVINPIFIVVSEGSGRKNNADDFDTGHYDTSGVPTDPKAYIVLQRE